MTNKDLQKNKEIKISIIDAGKKAMFITIPLDIILFFVYYLINGGYNILEEPWKIYFIIVSMVIVGFAIHELLHGIVLSKFSKKSLKEIEYGLDEELLKPYCICKEKISIKGHIINRAIPIIITGLVPYIISLIIGNFFIMVSSLCLIFFCGIDLIVILTIKKEDNSKLISDEGRQSGYINYNLQ